MDFILLAGLIILVCFDLRVLKKQNPALVHDVFSFPRWVLWILSIVLFLAAIRTYQINVILGLFVLFIFPLYLIRRYCFVKKVRREICEKDDEKFIIAMDAFGLLFSWLVVMTAVALIARLVFYLLPFLNSEMGEVLALNFLSSFILLGLIFKITKKAPYNGFKHFLGLKRNNQSWVSMFLFPVIVGSVFAVLASLVVSFRAYQPSTPMDELFQVTESGWLITIFLMMAVFFGAFI